jgi:Fe-Mn family superoxide dismutase
LVRKLYVYKLLTGELENAIKKDFGSLDNMKAQLSAISVGVQGSGWGWLGYNKQTKQLQVAACANQDPLEATTGIFHKEFVQLANICCKLLIDYHFMS